MLGGIPNAITSPLSGAGHSDTTYPALKCRATIHRPCRGEEGGAGPTRGGMWPQPGPRPGGEGEKTPHPCPLPGVPGGGKRSEGRGEDAIGVGILGRKLTKNGEGRLPSLDARGAGHIVDDFDQG